VSAILLGSFGCRRATDLPAEHLDGVATEDAAVARDAALTVDRSVDLTVDRSVDLAPAVDVVAILPADSGADLPATVDVASPCGGKGQPCCPDAGGACAQDPPGCGLVGAACCPRFRCSDAETVCVGADPSSATCKKCGRTTGAQIQPCCAGNQCLDGGCCIHLQSANIGPYCVRVGQVCWDVASKCASDGSCGPTCGAPNQPCCHGPGVDYCSASGTACMRPSGDTGDACVPCGKAGEPCCQQVASQYSIQPCDVGLTCTASGTDERCGP
jgi:hypothetical protein